MPKRRFTVHYDGIAGRWFVRDTTGQIPVVGSRPWKDQAIELAREMEEKHA